LTPKILIMNKLLSFFALFLLFACNKEVKRLYLWEKDLQVMVEEIERDSTWLLQNRYDRKYIIIFYKDGTREVVAY
jgi:hypothetical protein